MMYVDAALLDLTEYLCRRFQVWTGRTNVWLAFQLTNLSIVMYFMWVSVLYWLSGMFALRVFVAMFCGGVFVMLTRTIFRVSVEASEAQAYQRVAKGLRNPRRTRDVQLRLAFLFISVVLAYPVRFAYLNAASTVRFMLLTEGLTVLTTALLYILACDPLPPCESRVTSWVRALLAKPADAPAAVAGD